jgi:hypothetical protein
VSEDIVDGAATEVGSALKLLSDELEIRSLNGAEVLHVVMLDQRPAPPPSR